MAITKNVLGPFLRMVGSGVAIFVIGIALALCLVGAVAAAIHDNPFGPTDGRQDLPHGCGMSAETCEANEGGDSYEP